MKFKILVVEDEESINDILSAALKSDGYIVRSAFNGAEARSLLDTFKPNLALLDINLPDESGFEICKYINSNNCILVIMLTARNDIVDKVLGLELGADDYITKPFHIKEVLTRVKVALRRVDKYKDAIENAYIKINDEVKISKKPVPFKFDTIYSEEETEVKNYALKFIISCMPFFTVLKYSIKL